MPASETKLAYQIVDHDIVHGSLAADATYVLRLRDMDSADKPRERLVSYGPSGLTMAELVAVLLNTGTRREEVMTMSRRILREYGEQAIVEETNPTRLAAALSIPVAKACRLIAALELGRRYYQTRRGKPVVIRNAAQAFDYLSGMAHLQKEQLRAIYLGSRYQVVHEEVISVGSLTANIVHPREVFEPALTYGAAAVIIAHNHPSGSLVPSSADLDITAQLIEGGKLLGIELLDHLIVAGSEYLSVMGK